MSERSAGGAWASAYYFLYFAAGASFIPYLVLYYQSRGLGGAAIGSLTALPPLMTLWAGPFWTGIADATRRHRLVFAVATAGLAALAVLLGRASEYWPLLACALGVAILSAPTLSLADAGVMGMLGEHAHRYGRIRLWGAIGWGVAALVTGGVAGRWGLHLVFWIYAGLQLGGLVASAGFPLSGHRAGGRYLSELRQLLANRRWLAFLFLALVGGVGLSGINYYLFPYLEQLGATRAFMGLSLAVATLSEIVVFFVLGSLLKRWSARTLSIVAIATMALRELSYALIPSPGPVLLVQLLHGVCFSMLWGAGVAYARECAPPGLGATAQGIFGAMVMGVGPALGGYLGGVLLDSVGARLMYAVYGSLALAGLAAHLAIERIAALRRGAA